MTKEQEAEKKLRERQRSLKKQIASIASKRKPSKEELEKLNDLYNSLQEVTEYLRHSKDKN